MITRGTSSPRGIPSQFVQNSYVLNLPRKRRDNTSLRFEQYLIRCLFPAFLHFRFSRPGPALLNIPSVLLLRRQYVMLCS